MPLFRSLILPVLLGGMLISCDMSPAAESGSAATSAQGAVEEASPCRPHHGPPPEALAACADLIDDAPCEILIPELRVEGLCRQGPQGDGALACAPAGPPPGHHSSRCAPPGPPLGPPLGPPPGPPPPEAFAACAELDSGAVCEVTLPPRLVDGECRPGPQGEGPLACAPPGPGPHPAPAQSAP